LKEHEIWQLLSFKHGHEGKQLINEYMRIPLS